MCKNFINLQIILRVKIGFCYIKRPVSSYYVLKMKEID